MFRDRTISTIASEEPTDNCGGLLAFCKYYSIKNNALHIGFG
jgi:hypothetical protein